MMSASLRDMFAASVKGRERRTARVVNVAKIRLRVLIEEEVLDGLRSLLFPLQERKLLRVDGVQPQVCEWVRL